MQKPKISIVVPVYKAEKFLHKCIDSILCQTLSDLELILVDDGSPDSSGIICDDYARNDHRVRVIHQRNAGISAARNRGIKEARGDYFGFVDSDDWIDPEMYITLYTKARDTGADIVMCDCMTVYDYGTNRIDTISQLNQDCMLKKENLNPELMLEFAGSVWRCLYKCELIQENNIIFPVGLKFSEDRIFNIYAMGNAQKICYIKKPLYMRYVNMESCVNSFHSDHFLHAKQASMETRKAIRAAWNNGEDYQRAYLKQFVDASCAAVRNISNVGDSIPFGEKIAMLREICNDCDLQSAFIQSGYYGEKGRWIQKKRILLLYYFNDRMIQKMNHLKYMQTRLVEVIKKCISMLNL